MKRTLLAGAGALLLAAASASGIVRRDDVADSSYTALGNSFPSTGFIITNTGGGGSGVLISPEWVLTAAHVIDGAASATVMFGDDGLEGYVFGEGYNVDQLIVHPGWNGTIAGGNDLGLIHLSGPVSGASPPLPSPAALYAGSGEVGMQAVITGFGTQGVGSTGYETNPFLVDYLRRGCDNLISITADQDSTLLNDLYGGNAAIASTYLVSDFDDPPAQPQGTDTNNAYYSALDPLAREGSTAPGDSGGPVFVDFGSGWQVVGLNTWIDGYFDSTDNASYGDIFAAIRVNPFLDWIDQTTGIPEPATLGSAGLALIALATRRRERRIA